MKEEEELYECPECGEISIKEITTHSPSSTIAIAECLNENCGFKTSYP